VTETAPRAECLALAGRLYDQAVRKRLGDCPSCFLNGPDTPGFESNFSLVPRQFAQDQFLSQSLYSKWEPQFHALFDASGFNSPLTLFNTSIYTLREIRLILPCGHYRFSPVASVTRTLRRGGLLRCRQRLQLSEIGRRCHSQYNQRCPFLRFRSIWF